MRPSRLLLLLILLPLTACNQKADSSSAGTNSQNAPADEEFLEMCVENSNMAAELCDCIGQKAKGNLSEKGHDFLMAMILKKDDDLDRLRREVSLPEAAEAAMMMVNAPRECAAEQYARSQ